MIPLIAVAHGSRDPRSAATMAAAVAGIRNARPDLDVRLAFLDLNAPSVEQMIDTVAGDGHSAAVVVPLLLGNAFHARIDIPAIITGARMRHPRLRLEQAAVLGIDARLVTAVRHRIIESGIDVGDNRVGIAVAAVGSSSNAANARTRRLASAVVDGTGWRAVTCFATSTEPSVRQAISTLTTAGASRVVVAPWFLAPGLLTDRVSVAADNAVDGVVHVATIGAHTLLADVVLDRYDAAASAFTDRISLSA